MVKTSLEKWPKTDFPFRKIADENERAATTRKRSRHRGGDCDGYALHYFTSPSLLLWHNLFQRLYYLPIIYAAIYFGWRGGLVASTASAVCYIPHILHAWHHMLDYAMNQYAEI